jgi:hypothetical protein
MTAAMTYRAITGLSLVLVLASCASTPPTAVMDYDRNFDFTQVRNIAIQPIDRMAASSVVISDMQVDRINQALTDELGRRGYQVVQDNAQADMLLSWHLITQERMDVRSYNTSTRYNCWSCSSGSNVRVSQFTQGTFIVDLIDPQSLRSVWRSTWQSRLRDQPDPEQAEENRRAAASAIFAQFPPN